MCTNKEAIDMHLLKADHVPGDIWGGRYLLGHDTYQISRI